MLPVNTSGGGRPAAFLMVTVNARAQSELGLTTVPAIDVVRLRLHAGLWPIYARTKHRAKMARGCRLMFYVAGTGSLAQHIVAEGKIAEIQTDLRPADIVDQGLVGPKAICFIRLSDVREFSPPINLPRHREAMPLFQNSGSHWGVKLMGGCVALVEKDLEALNLA